jgi:hypothetical protein
MPALPFGGVNYTAPATRDQRVMNQNATALTPAAATRTYLAGSALNVGAAGGLKVGSKLRWVLDMTKTAAGIATSVFDVAVGPNGTTADTARLSFTKSAGTAAVDVARVVVEVIVRSVSATGVIVGTYTLTHSLASTGHIQVPAETAVQVSAGFDNRGGIADSADLFVGLCLTSGAADAITIQTVQAEFVS